jgi:hypothetical protein
MVVTLGELIHEFVKSPPEARYQRSRDVQVSRNKPHHGNERLFKPPVVFYSIGPNRRPSPLRPAHACGTDTEGIRNFF